MEPSGSLKQEALLSFDNIAYYEHEAVCTFVRMFDGMASFSEEKSRTCRQFERNRGPALRDYKRYNPPIFITGREYWKETRIFEVFSKGLMPYYDYYNRSQFSIEIEMSHLLYKSSSYSTFLKLVAVIRVVEFVRSTILWSLSVENAKNKLNRLSLEDQRAVSAQIPISASFLKRNVEGVSGGLSERDVSILKINKLQGSYSTMVSSVMNVFLKVIELTILFSQKSCWNIDESLDQDKLNCRYPFYCLDDWKYIEVNKEPFFNSQNCFALMGLVAAVGFAFFSVFQFAQDFKTARQEHPKLSIAEKKLLACNFKPQFLLRSISKVKKKDD